MDPQLCGLMLVKDQPMTELELMIQMIGPLFHRIQTIYRPDRFLLVLAYLIQTNRYQQLQCLGFHFQ